MKTLDTKACRTVKRYRSHESLAVPIASLLLCLSAWPALGDTIVYRDNGEERFYVEKIKIIKRSRYYCNLFLDFGLNRTDARNLFTGEGDESASEFPETIPLQSRSFSLHIAAGRRLAGDLSLMSGLGVEWFNFHFRRDMTLRESDGVVGKVHLSDIYSNYDYSEKTKLTASYLALPLMLRFDFRRFFLAAGVKGTLNISCHTRTVFRDIFGNEHKNRDYEISPATFGYALSVRAGFRFVAAFANYHLNPMFRQGEGPQVYPFTFGVSLKL